MAIFKLKECFLEFLFLTATIGFFIYKFILPTFNEVTNLKKAEIVEKNLIEIRVALEKYYQLTGTYPDLSKEGANNNLTLLDSYNKLGQKISFAEIYGKNILDSTEQTDSLEQSNKVIDSNNFENIDGKGGWIYDYSNQTGEIHPNLPTNIYFQNIDWSKQ
ncbi:hypothetical protein [Fusobacterium sp.]|uniref:hypothetical protein n=1 Tax=Fusobacterium sp. TaxID=68766 RepID=UPI00260D5999|nr:hypothetical protein [Fusobacterium sp.]